MPEKRYERGCGNQCVRCWRNKLKHGNKLKKKQFPKQNIWHSDESVTILKQEDPDIYNNTFEEFYDKYIVSNYTDEQMREVDKRDKRNITYMEHKNDLERYTYDMYHIWLSEEKKNNNRLTFSKFRKTLYNTHKNDYTKYKLLQYKDYYMYKCTYREC